MQDGESCRPDAPPGRRNGQRGQEGAPVEAADPEDGAEVAV